MRTLHMFMASVGTTVTLETSPDANVVVYGAVLEQIPGGVVKKWLPHQLEGAGGVSEVLGPAQGHNVIVLPVIKGKTATMKTTISFSDGQTRTETVKMTDNEPFGWRIFQT